MNRSIPPFAMGLALGSLLALGGCGKAAGPQAGPTANGEVLPGSVSDAMLDTDRSQATAPLAPAARSPLEKSDTAGTGVSASEAASDSTAATDGIAATELAAPPKSGPSALPKPSASPKPAAP
jgi:hypothetical protein